MVIVIQNKPVNKGFRNILSNRTLHITACISSILDVIRNTLKTIYIHSLNIIDKKIKTILIVTDVMYIWLLILCILRYLYCIKKWHGEIKTVCDTWRHTKRNSTIVICRFELKYSVWRSMQPQKQNCTKYFQSKHHYDFRKFTQSK